MNSKEDVNINKMYAETCISNSEIYLTDKNVNLKNGLSDIEVEYNFSRYGVNELAKTKSKHWYHYFFRSLFNPFNSILLGITLILFYTDVYLSEAPSWANIIVILVLITTSTLLDFFEEYRSNKTAEKLKELVSTTVTVIRNGQKIVIPVKKLTLNDIVLLSAGDMIPADLKILESTDLFVSQSTLTGESDAVKKVSISEHTSSSKIQSLTDLDTICFMGTNVISGYAKCIVIKVANSTYFGQISHTLSSGKPLTSFQKGVQNIGKFLVRLMLIMVPVTFLVTSMKYNILISFTFAVAVAITITPLLLPVILSSSLAKGARKMSSKKTIVKKLDSIQNFGSMNILCTDKTGTLTADKIVLEKYLNVNGIEEKSVLKHAFLNAYFQTGVKASIDEAIVERGLKEEITDDINSFTKFCEIPFDFARRRLSVGVKTLDDNILITKGAVEEMLSISSKILVNDVSLELNDTQKEKVKNLVKSLNQDGLRVIALSIKENIAENCKVFVEDECNMTLMGFVCFLDPPKESAKQAIEKLANYHIRTIVLTGDNVDITRTVCNKVGIDTKIIVTGNEVEKLSDAALITISRTASVFAKLSPIQKARVVRLLKEAGNVVGYLGDGINDSPSLVQSDVGISVDSAVDIAKETADIILLEKDLNVLIDGVIEGRKTFANLSKYIRLAASFNFGEASSVVIASILLPFFPITPIQLLVQSLLYDVGQISLPYDNVDEEQLKTPSKWSLKRLKSFILFMGPISSCFDMIVFALLWFHFGIREAAVFQTIWFSYGVVSNLIGMHIIRTAKLPFVDSVASKPVYLTTLLLSVIAIFVPFTALGSFIGLVPIKWEYIAMIFEVSFLYCIIAIIAKKIYIKKFKDWL